MHGGTSARSGRAGTMELMLNSYETCRDAEEGICELVSAWPPRHTRWQCSALRWVKSTEMDAEKNHGNHGRYLHVWNHVSTYYRFQFRGDLFFCDVFLNGQIDQEETWAQGVPVWDLFFK